MENTWYNFRMRHSLILVLAVAVFGYWMAFPFINNATPTKTLTVEDLPDGAEYVRHANEEAEAEEADKLSILHYATPEAHSAGGPTFGVVGYRIVSIEYEFPESEIPSKTVGQEFGGYVLALPGYKTIPYDHFHISVHDESPQAHTDTDRHEPVYSIHFMLISHEEELSMGLVCE